MNKISQLRQTLKPRYFHAPLIALAAAALLAWTHQTYYNHTSILPTGGNFWLLKPLWYVVFPIVIALGVFTSLFAAGASIAKRLAASALSGAAAAILYCLAARHLESQWNTPSHTAFWLPIFFKTFVFTFTAVIGALLTEILTPDPDLKKATKNPL
jgi:hypothetical protein